MSSVQFIELPRVWHYENTSKFWILAQMDLCNGDKCWKEIFYPFTHQSTGDDIAYAAMCALALIPSSIFLMWFTRDFW
jgi:hypothetical protein